MKEKKNNHFICITCETKTSKWIGNCTHCKEWNTYVDISEYLKSKASNNLNENIKPLNEIQIINDQRVAIGLSEFDNVMGGGAVLGSLTLIGGEPGVGKSTLLIQICEKLSKLSFNNKVLYISGEETLSQIALRAKRLGINSKDILIFNETSWENIKEVINDKSPNYLILDSIQTCASNEISSSAGSPTQVKEITYELMNLVKLKKITTFLIGHITKDGQIAGPKLLEHMVDTVIYLEHGRDENIISLKSHKNRFGNINTNGLIQMTNYGFVTLKRSLYEPVNTNIGISYAAFKEGGRNTLCEVEALVVKKDSVNAKRHAQGIDYNRLVMLLATVDKNTKASLSEYDIYLDIKTLSKNYHKKIDVAVVMAILSSLNQKPNNKIYNGEITLGGKIIREKRIDKTYNIETIKSLNDLLP